METREALVRCGIEILTERSFAASGIEDILKRLDVPKGSFYHYFRSKEAFGCAVIDSYADYFARKLDRLLLDASRSPLERIANFIADASRGMERHHFQRGCLVGNLGQEMNSLPASFRVGLEAAFLDWQGRLAACLRLARDAGELSATADCAELAEFFWTGWEGAVLRAKLMRDSRPLTVFARGYFSGLPYAAGRPPLRPFPAIS